MILAQAQEETVNRIKNTKELLNISVDCLKKVLTDMCKKLGYREVKFEII